MEQKEKEKNEQSENSNREFTKDPNIFETTYEKVLSIINQVKDFIKKTSKTSQKLIEDLEWVIKVITNKSLYSYEVNKTKILKQNEEYNKFINFVTKYNEEVLELNKKHILVSSLFGIGQKGEILLKPSLCLKKILPEELKSMDYQKEKEKKEKKRKSINQIGNIILNMYYRGLEQQKKEREEKENEEKLNKSQKIEQNEVENNDKNIQKIDENKKICGDIPKNKNNNILMNSVKIKKTNTTKNIINRISINEFERKHNFDMKPKIKCKINDSNILSSHKKEKFNYSQIYLNKKLTLNGIKKVMKNDYINNGGLNDYRYKRKNKSIHMDKDFFIEKNLKNNYYCISHKNENQKHKNISIKRNTNNLRVNNDKSKNNNKIEKKEEYIPILTLIDKYFNELRTITDKNFNIFEFKKKVGYKNVLPLMCHIIIKTLGLYETKIISKTKIDSFLYSVSNGYKESTLYHNSLHGADVTQSLCIFFLYSNIEEISETTVLDLLGIIISAMGHDLGHPGYNNNFHVNASTDLALTYNDISCLENYHTSFLFRILKKDENNILEKLNKQNYKSIRKRMISQILATDMANHGEVVSLIRAKIKASEEEGQNRFILLSGNEKSKFDEQQMLLNYLIHAADLGHNCKKFEISLQWVELLCEEFWKQGDMEKSKEIPVSFLCDRDKIDVPSSQVGFLRAFILTTFDCLASMFPTLKYTMDNANNNIKEWQKLLDNHRVRGWTPKKEKEDEKK